jgi:WD40 repeat protein
MHSSNNLLERALVVAIGSLITLGLSAQIIDEDRLRRIDLPQRDGVIACMEMLPDGHTLALGMSKGGGLVLLDTNGWTVAREIPLDGFRDGARIRSSADGLHLHLAEQLRWAAGNKDYKGTHAVLSVPDGREVLRVNGAVDAAMSADGRTLFALEGADVKVYDVQTTTLVRTIPVAGATNAVALSPDGRYLAVSHTPSEALLAQVPSVRNDKKALKAALKFRQLVSLYDAKTGTLHATIHEVYDIVRSMRFTADGDRLLILSTSDPRLVSDMGGGAFQFNINAQPGHLDQVDMATLQPLRASFMSRMCEPFIAVDPSLSKLALSSTEGRNKRKLQLYDLHSGETLLMIDLEQRRSSDKGEGEDHDGRLPYCWGSNGDLLIGQGDHIGIHRP